MSKSKGKTKGLPKSADTGRIVKKEELKKHPKTTYTQTVPAKTRQKKK